MIIDPDFLDHWRTRMLIDALDGDEMAPLYLLRIWAHCQSRRATQFDMSGAGLKALCRYLGDSANLESALIQVGFLERTDNLIRVLKWADHNAKLIANWENGKNGGKKKSSEPTPNPHETQIDSNHNPTERWETQPDPIREDKRRVEKREKKKQSASAAPQRPHDLLYNEFCRQYQLRYTVDIPVEYRPKNGDFVQLAKLKERYNDTLAELWPRAVTNYFDTEQSSHTIADLSTRFETFQKSALDKYGKPIEYSIGDAGGVYGKHESASDRNFETRLVTEALLAKRPEP